MIWIEDFFFDDPYSWKSLETLPKHSLEQSPCYPIIGIYNKYEVPFYYCKLHDIENIFSSSILLGLHDFFRVAEDVISALSTYIKDRISEAGGLISLIGVGIELYGDCLML